VVVRDERPLPVYWEADRVDESHSDMALAILKAFSQARSAPDRRTSASSAQEAVQFAAAHYE
jgi:hypothetical protein